MPRGTVFRMETVTIENTDTGRRFTWEDETAESLEELYAWLELNPHFILVDTEDE